MSSIIGILAVIFTFGVAILVHEFGHYLFAKLLGVGVEVFSIGFGKKLLKIKKGETTYALSVIPFGGYVLLKGAVPIEKEMAAKHKEAPATKEAPTDSHTEQQLGKSTSDEKKMTTASQIVESDLSSLQEKALVTKLAISGAGVFFNYLTAVVVLTLLIAVGYEQSAPFPPVVGHIEKTFPRDQYDIKIHDRILAVNDADVENWTEIQMELLKLRNEKQHDVTLIIRRDNHELRRRLPLSFADNFTSPLMAMIHPEVPAYVGDIVPNKPAEKAGLKAGDFIRSIDGIQTDSWYNMVDIIRHNVEVPLDFEVQRGKQTLRLTITPKPRADNPGMGEIGIAQGNPAKELLREPLVTSFVNSFGRSINISLFIVYTTYDMIRKMNLTLVKENVGGPIAIAVISYKTAKRDVKDFLLFFAAFNLMIVIVNMLPIPVLDGGLILISAIEAAIKRPIPKHILIKIYTTFLFLLIGVAILVTYNDIIMNIWRLGFER
jgi:regulator of sigma E protease